MAGSQKSCKLSATRNSFCRKKTENVKFAKFLSAPKLLTFRFASFLIRSFICIQLKKIRLAEQGKGPVDTWKEPLTLHVDKCCHEGHQRFLEVPMPFK
jgi:hypothetical protein